MTEDRGAASSSAGDHYGASPVEGEVGPQKVMLVPEDEEVAKVRWDGFRKQIGFEGDDESMESQGEDLH